MIGRLRARFSKPAGSSGAEGDSAKKIELGPARKALIVTFTTLAALLFCMTRWAASIDNAVYDAMFMVRGAVPAPENIVVVAIDEESFAEINLQWPWPRSLHAQLLDSLRSAGAKAVALDIIFAERSAPEEDEALARAVEQFGAVVLAQYIDRSRADGAPSGLIRSEALAEHVQSSLDEGLADVSLDPDSTVRSLYLKQEGERSMALALADRYRRAMGQAPISIPHWAVEEDRPVLINFLGPHRTVQTISYFRALDPERYGVREAFENSLVFVGFSTGVAVLGGPESVADHHLTPFGRMAGVEIHANAAANLLAGSFVRRLPQLSVMLAAACLGILGGVLFLSSSLRAAALIFLTVGAGGVLGSYSALAHHRLFIPAFSMLLPFIACYAVSVFAQYWVLSREKKFIRAAFSTYVSPRVVEQLIEQPDRLELGGEEQEATVIFLDIAGFTSVSETLPPRELIGLVNRNLGAFAQIVLEWDGMIDKYIGDCIMAVWGVPITQGDHAERACQAVAQILKAQRELSARESSLTGASLSVRIGVNSGSVIAGNVGGGQQFNYTVLGSEVNLASRLEGINKYYGTQAILSQATAIRLSDSFHLRELDRIRVVGQKTAVRIFELRGRREDVTPEMLAVDKLYKEGLALYFNQQWAEAAKAFEAAMELNPQDGPSRILGERCLDFRDLPPPSSWDGVFQMLAK